MRSTVEANFCKSASCPSSQSLVAYRRGSADKVARIEAHLAACDFCAAELQLLSRLDSSREEYHFVEMPAPLRNLAEISLNRRRRESSFDSSSPVQVLLRLAS